MSSSTAIIEGQDTSASSSLSVATLAHLPVDIFHLVFQSFSTDDLHSVSLVCKALHIFVEPLLYSQIHWTWVTPSTPPIIQFLRSILSRPQLATYVRGLVLDGHGFPGYGPRRTWPPKIPVVGGELEKPIVCVESLKVPYGEFWIQELRRGTMDAFVAVLLSQLSNLTNLRLGPNFAKDTRFVGMLLTSALCESGDWTLPTFQYLEDVTFDFDTVYFRDMTVRNTEEVLPLFYLPAVRHLSASIDNPFAFAWPGKHRPTPSALTSLRLSFIREAFLPRILSTTTGLKKLCWEWYYTEDFADQFVTPVIDLDQIVEALSPVRATLTDLTISACADSLQCPECPTLTIEGSLKAIVNFKALERFEAPLPFFLGFSPATAGRLEDVMPQNVEFVTITDDLIMHEENEMEDVDLLSAIQSWLEDWKTPTPHLRGISLLLRMSDVSWGPQMRNKLSQLCAEAGIQPGITKFEKDMGN